ncbi:integrase, catalytic region, zinc finger, CCHC-type containing protein [Tanacetum coccineum]
MRVSTNAPPSSNSSSNFEFQQMAAALEDKMTLTFRNEMTEMKNMMKAFVPTPVPIKAENRSEADRTLDFRALDSQITQLTEKASVLQEQNELFRVENAKVKQHYKELYDSIKITRVKHIDQTTALLTENENLKVQVNEKLQCVTIDSVTLKVLAPSMYAIDVESIPPRCRNNRDVHLEYLKHLKDSVATIREIVEEARTTQKTNVPVTPSTGVTSCTDASGSKPKSNTKKNRISPATSVNRKTVEDHPRINKSDLQNPNRVDSSISSKRTVINSNSDSVCQTCNKCFISANHDMCVVKNLNSMNASSSVKNVVRKVKQVWKPKQVRQVWKTTRKVLTGVGYQWRPTRRILTLGEQCPLTRFTNIKVVPTQKTVTLNTSKPMVTEKLSHTSQKPLTMYQRRIKLNKVVPTCIPTPTDASMQPIVVSASNWTPTTIGDPTVQTLHLGDRSRLMNFMKKFIETVRFGNDHFGAIMGYEDYMIGDSVISRVYYVEDGVELIQGSRGSNLYTISVEDLMKSSPICLLSKASKNKSWLWHRRLNHLNFGTINDLSRKDLVRGLPMLKFKKDHLCSACQLGKSKKHAHKPKAENTIMEVLHILHMDLCGLMRVQSINRKKYILVIVDDYSRFSWVKFLRSKD